MTACVGDKEKGGLVEVPMGEVDVRVVPGAGPLVLEVPGDRPELSEAMREVARRATAAPGQGAGR